jgi:anti-sigma factor RsiW
MSLPEIDEDELQAFVDGRLPEGRSTAVLAHLDRHPAETRRLGQYARHKDELRRALAAADLPGGDPTTAALQRTLALRLTRPDYLGWLRRAASVVLLLATGWSAHGLYEGWQDGRLPPLVAEAAQAHEVFGSDSQHPVELTAGSQHEMAGWFSRQLGAPIEIPSLRAIGLRLVGGRLLPGDETPVAQLIYEDRAGRRLTLCLSAESSDAGMQVKLVEVDGLNAGYWHDGSVGYALVAQTPDLQLVAIASELGAEDPEDLL